MAQYTWSFAQSFLVFLLIVFVSQSAATALRSYLPMPLLYGALFAVLFGLGVLPRDLLQAANMVAVGTIAFNVLVIHSGTMIDLRLLAAEKKKTLLCAASALVMTGALLAALPPLIGRDLALLAPGAVVGGGATCAIGSRWVSQARPEISFFPWMIFMFQGVFSVPAVTWALKKETKRLTAELGAAGAPAAPARAPARGLCAAVPQKYKTTAYYLGLIMIAGVLNYTLQGTVLSGLGINLNITALLLGVLAGNLGLIDRGPLFRSDSYGLLILSLMGLMANNLASTPTAALLGLVWPAVLSLLLGSAVLAAMGWLLSKPLKLSPYEGVILAMNSVMGFPVNAALAASAAADAPEELRPAVSARLSGLLNMSTALVSNGISVFIISVLVQAVK